MNLQQQSFKSNYNIYTFFYKNIDPEKHIHIIFSENIMFL